MKFLLRQEREYVKKFKITFLLVGWNELVASGTIVFEYF